MDFNNSIIKQAVKEAQKSTYYLRLGCVIFDKKIILSRGHNYSGSIRSILPKFMKFRGSVHAEVDAITKARRPLKGKNLLVVRINKKNQLRMAKPCSSCMDYMKYVGIRKVFYSINEFPYIFQIKIR